MSSWPSSSEPISFRNTASFGYSLCSLDAESGWGDAVWFYCGCRFFILWDVFKHLSCSLAFFHFSPFLSLSPCFSPIKKTKGNWQAARQGKLSYIISPWGTSLCCLIWKLSFSTSLGKSSHRPVTPKCLCWSIVPVSYWHTHWQLSLSTGIRNGSQLQLVQAAWEARKALRWYWHCKWRRFT